MDKVNAIRRQWGGKDYDGTKYSYASPKNPKPTEHLPFLRKLEMMTSFGGEIPTVKTTIDNPKINNK
ncbi:MAG: hypothetical protein J5529_07175 [Prevotella sp.]|nr:hypothetical protein [Prevotella sp.]